MPSYSRWNGVKCSGNKFLLTDVLKNELGFEGFLISDYNAIDQIDPDYKQAVEISINAGMDMAMAPNTYKQFYETLLELVKEGRVPESRIDDAVTRILRVKAAAGLLDKNRSQLADRSLHKSFGSRRAPRGGPRGRAKVARAAQERRTTRCRSPSSRREFTSAARAPTTSATNAAAGRSSGRAKAATSPPAARRFSKRSRTRVAGGTQGDLRQRRQRREGCRRRRPGDRRAALCRGQRRHGRARSRRPKTSRRSRT